MQQPESEWRWWREAVALTLPEVLPSDYFALRTVAAERLALEQALALRGSGWGGDLDAMREPRFT